ncbi:MAG TPA: sugar phosphate isomerase/epimerase family protein [Pirellulales bacterium]|jgi:sugar phosphate isomerase/epimerase|nr:sugar phosphate isomerase/epimerase family protein [Pirellulales bacterium]
MTARISRRQALSGLAAAAGGIALGAGGSSAQAIEAIARIDKPKFKFSLAAYSYRELLTSKSGGTPELTLDDFIRDCAKMQLDATELTSYYFPDPPSDEYLNHVKHLAFTLGLDISGTSTRNEFCLPPGPQRDEQLAYTKQWIDYAQKMAAPVIRIFSGKVQKKQEPAEGYKLAVDGIQEACDYAGKRGVFLALENHGGLTSEVDGMLKLVRDVQSPWFGVNLDTGNFHSDTPYDDLARIAPYALNVQVKVMMKPTSGKAEPADLKRLATIMRDAGYRGYIVLEYEEKGDPREACPQWIDRIREGFA